MIDYQLTDQSKYVDYTIFVQSNFGLKMEYWTPKEPEDWIGEFITELVTVLLGAIPYVGPVLSFAQYVGMFFHIPFFLKLFLKFFPCAMLLLSLL